MLKIFQYYTQEKHSSPLLLPQCTQTLDSTAFRSMFLYLANLCFPSHPMERTHAYILIKHYWPTMSNQDFLALYCAMSVYDQFSNLNLKEALEFHNHHDENNAYIRDCMFTLYSEFFNILLDKDPCRRKRRLKAKILKTFDQNTALIQGKNSNYLAKTTVDSAQEFCKTLLHLPSHSSKNIFWG